MRRGVTDKGWVFPHFFMMQLLHLSMASDESRSIMLCPRCGSTDIDVNYQNPAAVFYGLFQNVHRCRHCNYTSVFFPEVAEDQVPEEPQPAGKLEEVRHTNLSMGLGLVGIFQILGPLGLLVGIVLLATQTAVIEAMVFWIPAHIGITVVGFGTKHIRQSAVLRAVELVLILYWAMGIGFSLLGAT